MHPNQFQQAIRSVLQPSVTAFEYGVHTEVFGDNPLEPAPDYEMVWYKPLAERGYAYIQIRYMQRHPTFTVYVCRWARSLAVCHALGFGDIGGYVPIPKGNPLLLGRVDTEPYQWRFTDPEDLHATFVAVWQRLEQIVLPWLESPIATQALRVERAWYCMPFRNYVQGIWTREQAYAWVARFEACHYYTIADTPHATAAIGAAVHILRGGASYAPEGMAESDYLAYVLECLEGRALYENERF